ncbi:MAG: gamma-glutamyl-gamma-aminobutyrate hydrolase family protein [Methanoregulaceae archaeon]|nr:gamma-glutamyl-gamma-aminobutyrate hydrolase family protein [Methanoregulaceae archaeon]
MMVTIVQHVGNEPAGLFEKIFSDLNIPFEYIRPFETNELPVIDPTSSLLVMGGPMSVNDEKEYPFLAPEKALIRDHVRNGRPVLGICLGAQLIADAHGARVHPSVPETGWRIVTRTGRGPLAGFPRRFPVFQLHGETFGIPEGGTLLCTGDEVRNQAFSYGSALGLQFHLELTPAMLGEWSRELGRAGQDEIARAPPSYLQESNRLCRVLADCFFPETGEKPKR